jgi:hypothetical protein
MSSDNGNDKPPEPDHAGVMPLDDLFSPTGAERPRHTSGRIRDLEEARAALAIPLAPTVAALNRWGAPHDFWLVAYPVNDAQHPGRVAEFAVLRVVVRDAGRLAPRPTGRRLHVRETSNALWVVYGAVTISAHNGLVLETLTIGPAFPGQFTDLDDEIARGITTELLRLLSLPELINKVAERLLQHGHALDRAAHHGAPGMSETQRELLNTLAAATRPRAPVSDDELVTIAQRYIALCLAGHRSPVRQLAAELGISREQARDRVHKARTKKYLAPGRAGRATATIGPALEKLGWKPPVFPVTRSDSNETLLSE